MSNIKKWGYINKTYDECSRSSILRRCFSLKKFVINYEYWVLASIYVIVLVIAFCFSQTHFFWSVISIGVTALCIYILLEFKLSKDLKGYYDPNGLLDYSLFSRARYLSYILFKERLDKDKIVKSNDIDSIILWDEIYNEKIDTTVFFKSKWFLALVTGVVGLFVQYALGLKLNSKEVAVIAYLVLVMLWLSWIVFDFSNIEKKKRLDICRFLKWYKLENNKLDNKKTWRVRCLSR